MTYLWMSVFEFSSYFTVLQICLTDSKCLSAFGAYDTFSFQTGGPLCKVICYYCSEAPLGHKIGMQNRKR